MYRILYAFIIEIKESWVNLFYKCSYIWNNVQYPNSTNIYNSNAQYALSENGLWIFLYMWMVKSGLADDLGTHTHVKNRQTTYSEDSKNCVIRLHCMKWVWFLHAWLPQWDISNTNFFITQKLWYNLKENYLKLNINLCE